MAKLFKKFLLALIRYKGWTFDANMFTGLDRCVVIGAPHTSNWDFIIVMALFEAIKRPLRFTIKKEWLKFPFKNFMIGLGALPINRREKNQKMTDLMAELFEEIKDLILIVTPESTRSPNDTWKTGFYWVAHKANVPIALGFLDYPQKIVGVGKVIYPSGDIDKDMKEIMEFYRPYKPLAKHPEKFLLDKNYSSAP